MKTEGHITPSRLWDECKFSIFLGPLGLLAGWVLWWIPGSECLWDVPPLNPACSADDVLKGWFGIGMVGPMVTGLSIGLAIGGRLDMLFKDKTREIESERKKREEMGRQREEAERQRKEERQTLLSIIADLSSSSPPRQREEIGEVPTREREEVEPEQQSVDDIRWMASGEWRNSFQRIEALLEQIAANTAPSQPGRPDQSASEPDEDGNVYPNGQ